MEVSADERRRLARWLDWARSLQAVAQSGLQYADNPFDTERYEAIRRIAGEIAADHLQLEEAAVAEIFTDQIGDATP